MLVDTIVALGLSLTTHLTPELVRTEWVCAACAASAE